MAGIGNFFSSAIRDLVEGLQAGTEEGVRMEVEKIREDERIEKEMRIDRQSIEAERIRLQEEERKEKERNRAERQMERIRAERQKKRDDKTAFWTAAGLRPLAEPPVLDWDWLFRLRPSDLRFNALFPNDPGNRSKIKDLHGELNVLSEYSHCARMAGDDPETDSRRSEFYRHLQWDIVEDHKEVDQEYIDTWAMATELSRFEFENLDNDGRTTRLEQWIKKGADVFCRWGDEVREEYSYLVPQQFVENHLATFEFIFVPVDGSTGWLSNEMEKGHDTLAGWPQEVQDKYGHLRQYLP